MSTFQNACSNKISETLELGLRAVNCASQVEEAMVQEQVPSEVKVDILDESCKHSSELIQGIGINAVLLATTRFFGDA